MNSPSPPPRVRVVIVDDHPFFRDGLAAWILRQDGLAYGGCAAAPEEALALIARERPDVVLLDLQLREGDEMDVLARLRDRNDPVRVIVLSQKEEAHFAERAIRTGARGYVMKEEASLTVLAAIQIVMAGEIYVSPKLGRALLQRMGAPVGPSGAIGSLSDREFRVFELLGRGMNSKTIATTLGISPKTVDSYRESLKRKLQLSDSAALIRQATLWVVEGNQRTDATGDVPPR